mmetsp:Transcript_109930/g.319916  ORF Transcript_109930/g.319916 Transcript_109930/m.319916 type:complete len:169 (-) Transcript_109930:98-604(-)
MIVQDHGLVVLCFYDGTPRSSSGGTKRKKRSSSSSTVVVKSDKEKRQGATLSALYEAARILATDMDDLSTRVSFFMIDVFDPYLVDVAAMFNAVEVELPAIKFMHLGAATASAFDRSARVQKKWFDYDGPLTDSESMAEMIADAAENPTLRVTRGAAGRGRDGLGPTQ